MKKRSIVLKCMTSITAFAILSTTTFAGFTWTISSPTANTNFAVTSAVSVTGTCTATAVTPFTAYVYKDWSGAKVVMNSTSGNCTATGNYSCTVNPPVGLPPNKWSKTDDGRVEVVGADGGKVDVEVNFQ